MEGRMKEFSNSHYYNSNIDRLISAAERRVEALKIHKEICNLDAKLKILERMHPPQRADEEEQPSALDTPASS
jgi:hypothetical protein